MRFFFIYCLLIAVADRAFSAIPSDSCSYYVEGVIYDRTTDEPLPFSSVQIKGTDRGTVADEQGYFKIENLCIREFDLIFSFVGYKSTLHHHDTYHRVPAIYLAPDNLILSSVVIEAEYDALSMKTIDKKSVQVDQLRESATESFGEVVAGISGISVLRTGQNVSKPIIHGLHSNRVLVLNDEIRHEFQNWGEEHAPEIDPNGAERVEVIKGAATVRYGPDALGGVIMMRPEEMDLHTGFHGEAQSQLESNGRGGQFGLNMQQGFDNLSYRVSGSVARLGDLRAPGYRLTNTGRFEYSYSAGIRYHKENVNIEAGYSRFTQNLGILRGSVSGSLEDLQNSIVSEEPYIVRDFSYEINNPRQAVSHDLLKLKGSYAWDNQSVTIKYGFQDNQRREFDVRRGTNNDRPSIDLDLLTHSLDIDWSHPRIGNIEGVVGFQWMYQDNDNVPGTNTVPFVPNFNNTRAGIYAVESLTLQKSVFEAGFRYDYLAVSARGREANNDIFRNKYTYQNLTGTIGWLFNISDKKTFRSNVGMAWRPPNISELYAFGKRLYSVEYGLWRYQFDEQNNVITGDVLDNDRKNVPSEVGYKWLNTWSVNRPLIQYEITGYVNYITDYLYKRPAGITRTVRGVFPYFIYEQSDALFWGIDVDVNFTHTGQLKSIFSGSYLWAREILRQDYFIGIPPPNITYRLNWKPVTKIGQAALSTNMQIRYVFKQFQAPRVIPISSLIDAGISGESIFAENPSNFDLLAPPEAYILASLDVKLDWQKFTTRFAIRNMFNQRYRIYTDHLRYFADQPGINFILSGSYRF